MTDKLQQQADAKDQHQAQAHDDGDKQGQSLSQQNQEKVFYYSQKDVDNAKQMVARAGQMLGKLEIDGQPGVCRDEVLKAASGKNVSIKDGHVYDALANIEPNVQTAWQVPNHRAHLKMSSEGDFEHSAAKSLRKVDRDWSEALDKDATKLDKQSSKDLAADRLLQTDIYFKRGEVTPAKLAELKEQIGRVELAMHVMKNPRETVEQLIKKFDKEGDGLSLTDVQGALKSEKLSASERQLLTVISNTEATANQPTYKFTDMQSVLTTWAQGETRSDKHNKEQLFFAAIEGYNGNGIGIKSRERFNTEMGAKDGSQLGDYQRANSFRSIPHPK